MAGSLVAAIPVVAVLAAIDVMTLSAIRVAYLLVAVTAIVWRWAFGGVTGDIYGATNQLVELAVYATVVVVAT